MADLLQIISEALQTYWSSPLSLAVLAVCGASIGTLLYVFVTNARNAKLRVSLLTGLYSLSIFFWLFVATSLVLCLSVASIVAYRDWGIRAAAGGAVLLSFALSAFVSVAVWRGGADRVLRKIPTRAPGAEEAWLVDFVALVGESEDVAPVWVR